MTTGDYAVLDPDEIVDRNPDDFLLSFRENVEGKPRIFNDSGTLEAPGGAAYELINSTFFAENFTASEPISSALTFNSAVLINEDVAPDNPTAGTNDANWSVGTRGYLGVRWFENEDVYFGWVEIEYPSRTELTLHDFAYETSGGAIAAGAIPEPTTLTLIATILAGSAFLILKPNR